jgi:hypothetical protein
MHETQADLAMAANSKISAPTENQILIVWSFSL